MLRWPPNKAASFALIAGILLLGAVAIALVSTTFGCEVSCLARFQDDSPRASFRFYFFIFAALAALVASFALVLMGRMGGR